MPRISQFLLPALGLPSFPFSLPSGLGDLLLLLGENFDLSSWVLDVVLEVVVIEAASILSWGFADGLMFGVEDGSRPDVV